jgi:diadenosine tetraphosphate (Ap4A) HIT family hydrolase
MADSSTLGTMENVHSLAYRAHMEGTIAKGKCPLCDPLDPEINKVIRETAHFRLWANPFAYAHHEHHLIIAPVAHVTDIAEITPEMWGEIGALVRWAVREFDIKGGGLVMRFGDSKFTASTLHHLHMHIQVPDLTGPAFAVFCKTGFSRLVGD